MILLVDRPAPLGAGDGFGAPDRVCRAALADKRDARDRASRRADATTCHRKIGAAGSVGIRYPASMEGFSAFRQEPKA